MPAGRSWFSAFRTLKLWLAAAAVVLVALTVAAALYSPLFAIKNIRVEGAHFVDVDEIRRIAGPHKDENLFRFDASGLAEELVRLPEVKSVEIVRSVPDSVAIEVMERRPYFAVRDDDGYIMADDQGVAFATVDNTAEVQWMVEIDDLSILEKVAVPLREILTELPTSIASQVETVHVTSLEATTLKLTDRRVIRWGDDSENEMKSRVSLALLQQGHHEIDVSAPRAPTIS